MKTPEAPPAGTFESVRGELDFPADEARILAFWKARGIFHKTLRAETRRTGPSKGTFVFYEGPPTANGMPHNGHVLTRAVKDVFPRFQTMRGYDVPRKAGWDTHGLPVEVEVEKELGIHGKAEIERYGVKPFIARCIASVFRYTEAWEKLTDRDRLLGRPPHGLRHVPPELRGERVVGALRAPREGPALPRAPGLLVVAPGRHGALGSRGRVELQDRRRPELLRRVPARGRARYGARRLDHDAVDLVLERLRRRARRLRLRGRGRRGSEAHRRGGAPRGPREEAEEGPARRADAEGRRADREAVPAAVRHVHEGALGRARPRKNGASSRCTGGSSPGTS